MKKRPAVSNLPTQYTLRTPDDCAGLEIGPVPRLTPADSDRLLANYDVGPRDGDGRMVVAAMSGGVDSAVSALLLRERGYRVVGVNMRVYTPPDGEEYPNPCCAPESLEDARAAATRIGIPFYALNVEEEFDRTVIEYFVDEYARGRTPNPCLECNRHLKFKHLITKARLLGADFLATGHYVRSMRGHDGIQLHQAADLDKDQSYVLYALSQEQLNYLIFPLGGLQKSEVREIARQYGLNSVAGKPDSQDTCFVGKGAYADFVLQRRPGLDRPGPIVTPDGNVVGEHSGLLHYTIGQRRGIGVAWSEPLYVLRLDMSGNRLVVGPRERLNFSSLMANDVVITSGNWPSEPVECEAVVRYQGQRHRAVVRPLGTSQVQVDFHEVPRAVAPGQAVVFYDGSRVLGGGTIESSTAALRLTTAA